VKSVHPVLLVSVLLSLFSLVVAFGGMSTLPIVASLALLALVSFDGERISVALRLARYFVVGLIFLFLLYGIDFSAFQLARDSGPLFDYSLRLFSLFSVMFILSVIDQDRLFAALVHLHVSVSLIFLIFRTFWIVRLFQVRAQDVVEAQRLRGLPVKTFLSRWVALGRSARALINGLLIEMIDANVALQSKGVMRVNRPQIVAAASLGKADYLLVVSTCSVVVIWVTTRLSK
jgi:hypothetical protein